MIQNQNKKLITTQLLIIFLHTFQKFKNNNQSPSVEDLDVENVSLLDHLYVEQPIKSENITLSSSTTTIQYPNAIKWLPHTV